MKIRFTNPDPRDFPTLRLLGVVSGDTADVPAVVAHDLVAQDVAAIVAKPAARRTKPATKGAKPDKNEE